MTKDLNKNISSILYNHLNLPTKVVFNNGQPYVEWTYDATGQKVKKKSTLNGIQWYVGGVEYKDGDLEAIYHEEGRVTPNGSSWQYEYTLSDHLGNARVSFTDLDNNGKINPNTEILQTQSYYPFGLSHSGVSSPVTAPENMYQYNGKELQPEIGWIDYGARTYDPTIGRWGQADPLAEKYYPMSTYNYTLNNPIRFIDPDGMAVDDIITVNDQGYVINVKEAKGDHIIVTQDGQVLTFNHPNFDNDQLNITLGSKEGTRFDNVFHRENKTRLFTPISSQDISDTMNDINIGGKAEEYQGKTKAGKAIMSFGLGHGDFDFADDMTTVAKEGGNSSGVVLDSGSYAKDGTGGFIKFEGDNTLYNVYDAGNFMTGKAFNSIGMSESTMLKGANLNNQIMGRKQGFGKKDSAEDQRALSNGYNYNNVTLKEGKAIVKD